MRIRSHWTKTNKPQISFSHYQNGLVSRYKGENGRSFQHITPTIYSPPLLNNMNFKHEFLFSQALNSNVDLHNQILIKIGGVWPRYSPLRTFRQVVILFSCAINMEICSLKHLDDLSPSLPYHPILSHLAIISFPFDRDICQSLSQIEDWRDASLVRAGYLCQITIFYSWTVGCDWVCKLGNCVLIEFKNW